MNFEPRVSGSRGDKHSEIEIAEKQKCTIINYNQEKKGLTIFNWVLPVTSPWFWKSFASLRSVILSKEVSTRIVLIDEDKAEIIGRANNDASMLTDVIVVPNDPS